MLLIGFCKFWFRFHLSYILFCSISDRFRTAINVFGDSIGCAIVQHLSRKELDALDRAQAKVDLESATKLSAEVVNITYDNPIFISQTETLQNDAIVQTKL